MNFALFIDYANLFHNIQNIYGIDSRNSSLIEDKICECINKTTQYVKTLYKNKEVNIVGKVAYVLPDEVYGNPSKKLKEKAGIIVKVVKENRVAKTDIMKKTEQSRNDDKELARGVINVVKDDRINGVIVVSNDNDFENVAQQVQGFAKYFWCGAMEGKYHKNKNKAVRCGRRIKNVSDRWLPLYDILQNNDEGEVLDEIVSVEQNEVMSGPRLEIFKDMELVVSYPINKKNISIGRRSLRRNHIPNIDLTEFDKEKIISRQHAKINKIGDRLIFSVDENCSRYTWYKTLPRTVGSNFTLEPDQAVILGDKDGFVMFYKID